MQSCFRGSKQHYIRKTPVQCLDTPRTTLHRSKSYTMFCERMCNVVLLLLGNIAQEKIQAVSSEQHLVTLFTYTYVYILYIYFIYIYGPSRQKKQKVILPLLWKSVNQVTIEKTAAWHSTWQPIKLLVRCYLNKKKIQSTMQCCQNPCNLVSWFS